MKDCCISCGEAIPEGRMVCSACERKNKLPPCINEEGYKCPARKTGCHSECEEYMEWEKVHGALREQKRKAIYADNDYRAYMARKSSYLMRRDISMGRKKQ